MLQEGTLILQFVASAGDLVTLRSIRRADWIARRDLHVGTVFGVAVHWAFRGGAVTVLVGHDDEMWQIAVSLPVEAVDRLAAMAVEHLPVPDPPEPDPRAPYPGLLEIF
jgi:hypothetical protein